MTVENEDDTAPLMSKDDLFVRKACIEEYASWLKDQGDYFIDYVNPDYKERMFGLLEEALPMEGVNKEELLRYCKTEMKQPQYQAADMYDNFNDLLMILAKTEGAADFISFQDKLLSAIPDKSSWDAQKILTRKIEFYRTNGEPGKAWEVIRENLQIESFRMELAKQMVEENRLDEAKKLINEYISENKDSHLSRWYELKLQIAQKEKDTKTIQSISFYFIRERFNENYYILYKSTFSEKEWTEEVEKLLKHYKQKGFKDWFNSNIGDILLAEKEDRRLMEYVEKNLSLDAMEKYYKGFSDSYPEETLKMFRTAIDKYSQNTGRNIYEQIKTSLYLMLEIPGGINVVKDMINNYRTLYKRRKAMMEMLMDIRI